MDWTSELDIAQALVNIGRETRDDWYRDPWAWPENRYLKEAGHEVVIDRCTERGVRSAARIDVPKENFGVRPALVLDPLDRIVYQMLVDRLSIRLIGDMRPDSFGWRLPSTGARAGGYSDNRIESLRYRGQISRLADLFPAALKTDISSFFASIDVHQVCDELSHRTDATEVADQLASMLVGWELIPDRGGLPQRSTASAVLANMLLLGVDDLLWHQSRPAPKVLGSPSHKRSYARWMDDIWLFHQDSGHLRATQVLLQQEMRTLSLNLNSGKTELLEDQALADKAKKVEFSAVDYALKNSNDSEPLESVIDRVIEERELADRSTIRFVTTRMRNHSVSYRQDDLLASAHYWPHAADHLARLFRVRFPSSEIQDWFQDYEKSTWNAFDWSLAQFGTAISSRRAPRSKIRAVFESALETSKCLPLVALAAQRLTAWDTPTARVLMRQRLIGEDSPLLRRALALAGLDAGESRGHVKRLLKQLRESEVTLRMLEHTGFAPQPVSRDYL